jgi:hypothetical protein
MHEPWFSIQLMPYKYFESTLKWKMDLEEQKKKLVEERNREMEAEYRKRANIQKSNQRKGK